MNSIRHRLLFSLFIGLLISTAIMVGIAYVNTTHELHELFVDNLRRMAVVIKGHAFPSASQNPTDIDTEEMEESYIIQIWDQNEKLLRSSRPDQPLPLEPKEGLNHYMQNNQAWEIYTLKAVNAGYVQIAQPREIVSTMIGESAFRALTPFILLFILILVGGWIAVGRSLRPVNHLSETISGWDVNNIQPLRIANVPQEIQPLAGALNNLLLKLDKALSVQQQFTADSAHELRTPLTAIKLQLDNLVKAPSEKERKEAIGKLSDGIDRCIHLATQLLTASRSMAVKTAPEFKKVNLSEIIRSSLITFVVIASKKDIEIAFENDTQGKMLGDEDGLRALINNLIDNAIRYTPKQGHVTVRLSEDTGNVILEVTDDGPGIPKNEHDRVFQRFYRIPGTVSTGSGLGLSIVKSVAENHDAVVTVESGLNQYGTIIRVIFPVAT